DWPRRSSACHFGISIFERRLVIGRAKAQRCLPAATGLAEVFSAFGCRQWLDGRLLERVPVLSAGLHRSGLVGTSAARGVAVCDRLSDLCVGAAHRRLAAAASATGF